MSDASLGRPLLCVFYSETAWILVCCGVRLGLRTKGGADVDALGSSGELNAETANTLDTTITVVALVAASTSTESNVRESRSTSVEPYGCCDVVRRLSDRSETRPMNIRSKRTSPPTVTMTRTTRRSGLLWTIVNAGQNKSRTQSIGRPLLLRSAARSWHRLG
jgi:hypothetical protein